MSEQTRTSYKATYYYPGAFFAESASLTVPDARLESIVAARNDSNWYAVDVKQFQERRYEAANGDVRWIAEGEPKKVASWIIGERVHWEDIPDTDSNRILRSNIRSNSKDGYGVLTRCGNWQIASDWNEVVPAA